MLGLVKITVLTMATFISSFSFAKTLTCPIGMMMATTDVESETKTGKSQMLAISMNNEKQGEGTIAFKSNQNENVEVSVMVNSDDKIKGIYELSLVTLVNNQRQAMSRFLVKDAGISSGSDWDLGPKGATQLKMMFPNSLSEKAVDAQLFMNVFKVLKDKYGMTRSHEDGSTYPMYEAVSKAVQKKDLKEGQAIGTVVYMGCWLE